MSPRLQDSGSYLYEQMRWFFFGNEYGSGFLLSLVGEVRSKQLSVLVCFEIVWDELMISSRLDSL